MKKLVGYIVFRNGERRRVAEALYDFAGFVDRSTVERETLRQFESYSSSPDFMRPIRYEIVDEER